MPKPILALLWGRLRTFLPSLVDLPDSVWRRTGALNTWGTNAIEGNTLTHEEVQRLLLEEESIAGRPVPDVVETIQHDRAFRGLLDRLDSPIRLVTVLELHEIVFRGSARHRPGEWRRSNVYIAGARHRPPAWPKVVSRMTQWEASIEGSSPPWAAAARMHQSFEEIHPFEDGNGRVGRLVLNLWLMQQGWPPLHVTPDDRSDYLAALAAGNEGDHEKLEALLQSAMVRSLLDLLDQVGEEKDMLRPLAELAENPWCPHAADYLALRCRQGALAGIHATSTSAPDARKRHRGRPRWLTSENALRHYLDASPRTP